MKTYHDGEFEHVVLECRSCGAALVDIIRTVPEADCALSYQATCPWCGDCSFEEEIQGGVHVGGVGEPNPDDPTDQFESTAAPEPEFEGDVVVFQVRKANERAQPYYHR